ncbi:MAG: arylamine N-acetyltransferase [Rhodospirillales bacterium]|nr:arylamine N-acetyltransferase [Rhodospirillales bacterium]
MLDAYFARIGYGGSTAASLATLRALHALHPAAIPFEALDPLLHRPVSLEPEALERKLIASRRGGYCFEQNAVFAAVLRALGFTLTDLAARVVWNAPPDAPMTPRTHRLMLVALEGAVWLADVGFGGYLADAPLLLEAGREQATPMGRFLLREQDGAWLLSVHAGGAWRPAYRFTLEAQAPVDYEPANWFTATHPASLFRHNLLMERLTPAWRASLFNRGLTIRHADGRSEARSLDDAADLAGVLAGIFAIDPPAEPAAIFARLPAEPATSR